MKIPLIFFGASSYVLPIIKTLNEHFDLKFVVTTEKKSTDAVPALCYELDITSISVESLKDEDIQQRLKDAEVDVAVLASFGLIIPQDVLDIFPKGIVNIHPSYLPYYRGTTPIQEALKNGDTETAVSIMIVDKDVDHGPLLAQIPLSIDPTDTTESLYTKAFTIGAQRLVDILPAYLSGTVEPREQDHSKATYTPRHLTRESGFVELKSLEAFSSTELDNLIRAYYPWPGVWTKIPINNAEKIVKLLPNHQIQVEGKKPLSYKDFLNGYPQLRDLLKKVLEK